MDVVGRWAAETFGEPVEIGGVRIETGDYLLADRDGAVVIPAALVEKVVTRTEKVMRTENKVRTAILRGVDPQEAYLKYGKFSPRPIPFISFLTTILSCWRGP